MASYRGVPYEAAVGPTDSDIVLFAAHPPPETLGFQRATGLWRKEVHRAEVDAVWESRPSGAFGGRPCLVLDDLGDELHIGYLGQDPAEAERLGYCQVEPGVFEVLVPREDVTGVTEERVGQPYPGAAGPPTGPVLIPVPAPAPEAAAVPDVTVLPAGAGLAPGGAPAAAPPGGGRRRRGGTGPAGDRTRQTFSDLVDLAALPQHAYSVNEEVDGAFCLLRTERGYEVFSSVDGTRQEVRVFSEEEAAYFYLFGLLAAEAVRDGRLVPRHMHQG
ncbi:MAG TPA: hypothetical protein VGM53_27880 [Streptosporangiaceae bacterium]|jgi:hypothetical protein